MITTQGHPVAMLRRASELRDAGWSYGRIADLLSAEFNTDRPVHKSTVYRWSDEQRSADYRERERARKLEDSLSRSGGRLGAAHHTPEFRLLRAAALRGAGLNPVAVAAVMAFDYRDDDERPAVPTTVKFERLQELRPLPGMSFTAIASVMTLEYGEPCDAEQVRYAHKIGRWPRERKTLAVAA